MIYSQASHMAVRMSLWEVGVACWWVVVVAVGV